MLIATAATATVWAGPASKHIIFDVTGALVPGSNLILTHVLTDRESCDRVSTEEQLCDTYDNIVIQGTDRLYKVQCCGTGVCAIHASTSAASDSVERGLQCASNKCSV